MNQTGDHHKLHRFLTLLLMFMLLFGGLPMIPAGPRALAQDSGPVVDIGEPPTFDRVSLASEQETGTIELAALPPGTVNLNDRSIARQYFNQYFVQTFPALNWSGNYSGCVAGTISSAYRQAVLDQIAWYRVMAGVSGSIGLSSTFSTKAQAAALIMGANQSLSHFPSTAWDCYTPDGAEAASKSNIAIYWGGFLSSPVDFVTQYMVDAGSNNGPVGHRRWLLYPQLQTFGVGTVGNHDADTTTANAIWVMDGRTGDPRPSTRDGFVAWPPPGFVPYQVIYPRWSFSYPGADFSGATVTVKRGSTTLTAGIEHRGTPGGAPESTIVWNVSGNAGAQPSADTKYTVTINNVQIGGSAQSFTYDVVVFDPAVAGSGSLPYATMTPASAPVGTSINYTVGQFPANSTVTVKWRHSPTSEVTIGTVSTNSSGTATGTFTVPLSPGGPHALTFTSGSTSAQEYFTVSPDIEVLTPTAPPNGTVQLKVTGFGANAQLRVTWYDPDEDEYFGIGGVTQPVADQNGQQTFTMDVPGFFLEPGPQRIRVTEANNSSVVAITHDFTIVTEPPTAVTNGVINVTAWNALTVVNLDGSDSQAGSGGFLTNFTWRLNGAVIATGQYTSAEFTVGTHQVELTVTDNYGQTDTAMLTVNVTPGAGVVIANAGPDQAVPTSGANASVTLNGSGSTTGSGVSITQHQWRRVGQSTVIATGPSPTISLAVGTHQLELTVTGSNSSTDTDTVTIVVGPPPVANAGPDQAIDVYASNAQVTFNGSASTAPGGTTITSYQWTGLPGGMLTGVTPTATLPAGTHTATLKVTTSNGMFATDTVTVTVTTLANPTATVDPERAAAAAMVEYAITNFPRNSTVTIRWITNAGATSTIGSVSMGNATSATGTIVVPAAPGGPGHQVVFEGSGKTVTVPFEVRPRISPSVTSVSPGQAITVNLRGFAPRDDVLLRWKVGNGWVNLGTIKTSSTGSVTNFPITVPSNADTGTIRVEGAISQQSNAITIVAPAVSITPARTTVNNWITYEISQFPANSSVQITWRRLTGTTIDMGTAQTDANGNATGQFRVPATPGGAGQQITFSSGGVTKTVLFEVAPRVKVTPAPAERGETIDISLRGFARMEAIRIRWRMTGSSTWIVLANGTTSNTGSANIRIPVPAYAADGTYQLRAETASFNQQTNTVAIQGGGQVVPAAEVVVTPEPTVAASTPVDIDRSALPLDATIEIVAITDEQQTPDLKRPLSDGDLATGWSGPPDQIRGAARLTIDLGAPHTLRGFAWLTETGGCGKLTGLDYSMDGETWTAFDPSLQPGPIGEGMRWRYQPASQDARFIRFTFAPETSDQTMLGCLAEVAVWGTVIVVEEAPVETPVPTELPAEPTVAPTEEPVQEPVTETPEPVEAEPTPEPEESAEG